MLNMLRKRAQSTLIQAIVLIIAIVFIFWGVGTNLGNKKNVLATVNGEEIPIQDYQRVYDNTLDNYRQQFGGSIPPGFLESLGLQQQVMSQLIQAEILRQSGLKMGLSASKAATQDKIKEMEVFQSNGQFDLNRYKEVLSQNRMNPTSFEAGLQNDLLLQRVQEAVSGFSGVTEGDIRAMFDYRNEEINVAYVELKSEDFKDRVEVNEEELAKWYEENSKQYMTEPKRRLKYLYFGFDDDMDQVEVTDEKIQARYDNQKDRYDMPEERHARHILFKVEEGDGQEVRADKMKKAGEVLQLAREGQDFAELAKTHSEGPSGPQGGDLGFFKKGAMVGPFDEAVFQMKSGEISEVVETVFGYHIIKLEEVKPATVRTLEDVRSELAEEIKKNEVKGYTFNRASKAYEDIILSGSLDKYSDKNDNVVLETDFFARSEAQEPPVSSPKFLQTAFSLNKGELSSLVETDKGYAIVFVEDIQQPEVPDLESVRDRVVENFSRAKSVELAKEQAQSILTGAKEKESLVAGEGVEVQESGYVKRTDPANTGGLPVEVVKDAFNLPQGGLPQEPLGSGNVFYVYQVKERRQGETELDETTREQMAQQLKGLAEQELMTNWLAYMQSQAKVWTNQQFLQ